VYDSEPPEALNGSQLCELEQYPSRPYKMRSSRFARSDLSDSTGDVG
jgi:hypothetical protein